ncbi:MAG: 16S rRNA (cytosine(1402)-N(4))-methyltransferase RsmH [Deltaproteobacteria bacterium]|nr:16S rRNA (cytosine(1402)-N(4))-methyltransferase RsmH [Deltaproteobacteria bacterium]
MKEPHEPVLVHEVVRHLLSLPHGTYVDGTAGAGGHSLAIGKCLTERGRLICLDRDPDAVRLCRKRLTSLGKRVRVLKASYADLDNILADLGIPAVDGLLLDLGMSSFQLEKSGRGFSFSRDEPLDMRMDPEEKVTAGHLVNTLSLKDLAGVFRDYGEEKRAKLVAGAIVKARRKRPIRLSSQLAVLIQSAFPPSHRFRARHPATRTFQALRIAVNRELENMGTLLDKLPSMMAKGGRLVVISYHSLEDRLVKQAMVSWEGGCTCPPDLPVCACGNIPLLSRCFKKAITPGQGEIERNPRARSAKLRAAERI